MMGVEVELRRSLAFFKNISNRYCFQLLLLFTCNTVKTKFCSNRTNIIQDHIFNQHILIRFKIVRSWLYTTV